MIWCTYLGKTFCQVSTDHKLVNTTKKLQFGVMPGFMVTEKSFWDKKLNTVRIISTLLPVIMR
jgi:hypothetical protein